MASTYSPNLRLELIGTGEQQGTWGVTTNTNLGTLLEEAIGGYTSVTVTDGADTTLSTNNGSADQSRNMTINLTGALTAARNVICPAIEKVYIVKNATTGGYAVTFKVSGQTGVSIPNGSTYILYVNGTDAVLATGTIAAQNSNNVSITGGSITGITDLAVADGGTGASTAAGAATNLGLGTGDSPQFAAVNIGNATDTTITRVSAGVIAVEGKTVVTETGGQTVQFAAGSNTAPSITTTGDTNTGIYFPSADTIAFTEGGTEAMRIDSSGNVGIGTAPSTKLDVVGSTITAIRASNGTEDARLFVNAGVVGLASVSNTPLYFYTNNVERMRIDSSGNVGIGATVPGATGFTSFLALGNNNSGIGNAGTNIIGIVTGNTERMRIDASGNVGIGTTSPGSSRLFVSAASSILATLETTAASSDNVQIRFKGTSGDRWAIGNNVGTGGTGLNFEIYDLANSLTRFTINSSGNVGIGTSSPGGDANTRAVTASGSTAAQFTAISGTVNSIYAAYSAYGALVGTTSNHILGFQTNNTERMRIRSDGGIGIGGTGSASISLSLQKSITGGTTAIGVDVGATVLSDVTTGALGYNTSIATQAASFSTILQHYRATQSTIGAGSTVSLQIGFSSTASLIGATDNQAFRAADTAAVTSGKTAYGFYSAVNTATGGGTTYGFYAGGTARNLFSGDVQVFGAGGLGYTTGSGGAVTQGTSRTTGVTLDKTNGAITLFSAAGTTTWQSFTVTNSTVAATDTIIVCQKSGTDLYELHVTAVSAGSFRISFRTTGGTTTEQPVFNFAVIKAVTA